MPITRTSTSTGMRGSLGVPNALLNRLRHPLLRLKFNLMNDHGLESASPSPPPLEPHYSEPPGSEPSLGQRIKKLLAPIGVAVVLILKFAAKLKFLVVPLFKFLPVLLKTGGTMLFSIWAYALAWGWMFALGFVLLLFVHECGHLVVARYFGLSVGTPVFIPFMGALIALKDAPKDAWMEAWVGIGGPLLGTAGAAVCEALFVLTGNPLFPRAGLFGVPSEPVQPAAPWLPGWRANCYRTLALVVACRRGCDVGPAGDPSEFPARSHLHVFAAQAVVPVPAEETAISAVISR